MEKYIIAGREYDVKEREPVHNLPIVDIPMMSDERWNQLCRESTRVHWRTIGNTQAGEKLQTMKPL